MTIIDVKSIGHDDEKEEQVEDNKLDDVKFA